MQALTRLPALLFKKRQLASNQQPFLKVPWESKMRIKSKIIVHLQSSIPSERQLINYLYTIQNHTVCCSSPLTPQSWPGNPEGEAGGPRNCQPFYFIFIFATVLFQNQYIIKFIYSRHPQITQRNKHIQQSTRLPEAWPTRRT